MRKEVIANYIYYHIYNRGNNKQEIFCNKKDYIRFLFLILFLQSKQTFLHIGRHTKKFQLFGNFGVNDRLIKKIVSLRNVEIIEFSLMPNHFHLIVRQIKEGGISNYMQRVQLGYTKYFNIKNKNTGHLFQGPYNLVTIKDNNQLLYLSTYIHKQAKELIKWKNNIEEYPWSSYQDYITNNRWGELLNTEMILEQFSSVKEYNEFVNTSIAKEKI